MDATARIKNLSIALEAISRINHEGSGALYTYIEQLLNREFDAIATEDQTQGQAPARPAEPTSNIPTYKPLTKA